MFVNDAIWPAFLRPQSMSLILRRKNIFFAPANGRFRLAFASRSSIIELSKLFRL